MPPPSTPAGASPTPRSPPTVSRRPRITLAEARQTLSSLPTSTDLNLSNPAIAPPPRTRERPASSTTRNEEEDWFEFTTAIVMDGHREDANIDFLRESLEALEEEDDSNAGEGIRAANILGLTSDTSTSSRTHVDALRDPRQAHTAIRQATTRPSLASSMSAAAASVPESSDWETRLESLMQRTNQAANRNRETIEDAARRERLQRVLARLNRMHGSNDTGATAMDSGAGTSTNGTANAYANRTPSPNQQNLYDWAPGTEDDSNSAAENLGASYLISQQLETLLGMLRTQLPEANPEIPRSPWTGQEVGSRHRRVQSGENEGSTLSNTVTPGGFPSAAAARAAMLDRSRLSSRLVQSLANNQSTPNESPRDQEQRRRETEWLSLRARAAQNAARDSPSSTDRVLQYIIDRERHGLSEEEARVHLTTAREDDPLRWDYRPPANSTEASRQRDRRERVEAFRRDYLADNGMPPRLPRVVSLPGQSRDRHNSASTPFLENALKYLSELRGCKAYEEALSVAIDHGLATKEFFADKHDDFIMDLSEIDSLPETSWLQPGAVFEGYQYAAHPHSHVSHHRSTSTGAAGSGTTHVEQINPHFSQASQMAPPTPVSASAPGSNSIDVPFDATRPWLSHQVVPPASFSSTAAVFPPSSNKEQNAHHDNWRVRVVIHGIDHDKMVLQGTMEAYDVPQPPPTRIRATANPSPASNSNAGAVDSSKPPSKPSKPIITYVDGHIIDLRTHSLLTPPPPSPPAGSSSRHAHLSHITFPSATAATDAANWHKLPPFNDLPTDAEFARTLLSAAHMRSINEQYIFMRWKERCFVHAAGDEPCGEGHAGDRDRGHGLTISGFYYVSLRRADGKVEGLYYDPCSTPYQHLRLTGVGKAWPAYELR